MIESEVIPSPSTKLAVTPSRWHSILQCKQLLFRMSSGSFLGPFAAINALVNTSASGTSADQALSLTTVSGVVIQGHQVASGRTRNSPYPAGTIEMQTPHFAALGVDISPFYAGTLNVSIAPAHFELLPKVTLNQVQWSPHHAAESFSFVPIQLEWQQKTFGGLIYYPRPETKIDHFQSPSVLELLLPKIEAIAYGSLVALTAPSSELIIRP